MTDPDNNPVGLNGIEFVEFASPDPDRLHALFLEFGFSRVMRHRDRALDLYTQHDIVLLLNRDPNSVAGAFAAVHGPSIASMGWRVFDGPAARDVEISAVVACLDTESWRGQALGDDELPDGRPVAQVVVGQAEFADVLVLTEPEHATLAILTRLLKARPGLTAVCVAHRTDDVPGGFSRVLNLNEK